MATHPHTPQLHEHSDEWHSHNRAEGLPQAEHLSNLNTGVLVKWFILIVVSLAVTMIAIGMFFTKEVNAYRRDAEERVAWQSLSIEAAEARANADKTLSANGQPESYSWTPEGAVQLPLSKAIEKVEARYRNRTN